MTRDSTESNEILKDPAEFPGWTNLGGGDVARRSVMKGAAWSLPVIALTVATPLAAASTTVPNMDIAITTLNTSAGRAFVEAPAGVVSGQNAWNDNQVLHNEIRIENAGTDLIPAGAVFTVTYPATSNGIQAFSNPSISGLSNSTVPGATTTSITPVGPATVSGGAVTRSFVVGVAIPPGTGFTAQLSATVASLPLGTYLNNTIKGNAQLPAGNTDANPGNNAATGAVFAFNGRRTLAKVRAGGAWNSPLATTNLQLNSAFVDTSACVGTPAARVLSYTAQYAGGTVSSSNVGNVQFVLNAPIAGGGTGNGFSGTLPLPNRPSGALIRLTMVVQWTAGCGVGTQTLSWGTTPIAPGVNYSGYFTA